MPAALTRRSAEVIASIIAEAFDIPAAQVFAPTRGSAIEALARAVLCYFLHCEMSIPQDEIARLLDRHPSSPGHAIRRVEDRRDDPEFDRLLALLTNRIHAVFNDFDDRALFVTEASPTLLATMNRVEPIFINGMGIFACATDADDALAMVATVLSSVGTESRMGLVELAKRHEFKDGAHHFTLPSGSYPAYLRQP